MQRNEEKKNAYRLMMEKVAGKRLLGKTGHSWVDYVMADLGAIEWDDAN
jgi:glutamate-1-semialdehyde aminotransferase